MRLYHASAHADRIRRHGFRDSDAVPSLGIHAGVWFADVPTHRATTHSETTLLAVEIPDDIAGQYLIAGSPGEVVEEIQGDGWREFCVPTAVVNRYPVSDAPPTHGASETAS